MKAVKTHRWMVFAALAITAWLSPTAADAASQHLGQRMLRQGMQGHDVRVLQQYLTFSGFQTPIDGSFGPTTQTHVRAFEQHFSLRPNGIVNRRFVAKIRAVVANREGTAAVADSSGGASLAPPAGRGSTSTNPTTGAPSVPSTTPGAKAVLEGGQAVAPDSAPQAVKNAISAANQIADTPYIYGGGHASFNSSGYDCSGSVGYALHGGGLLSQTEDSGEMESYGSGGAGQWITLWANAGHVYMNIAGLWFDTAAQRSRGGSRWSTTRINSASGYVERHPTGY